MRNWKAWTEADDKLLKKNAATMTSAELSKLLDRGPSAIKHRASKLGISLKKYGEKCSYAKYSDAVCEKARELHDGGMRPVDISRKLNVPYWNVCDFVYYRRGLGYGYETA